MKYDESGNPRPLTGEDKFLAGMIAIFFMLLAVLVVVLVWALIAGLWSAGLTNSIVIIGFVAILVGIWRFVYHIVLKKDIL